MARSTKQIHGEETVHYVSQRVKRGRKKAKITAPMMPMIDVTFQLLIYFLLTTTFRQAEGQIPGTLPKAGTSGTSTMERLTEPIEITLHPTGESNENVFYEVSETHEKITKAQQLKAILKGCSERSGPETPIIINARRDVRWRFVVEVFNQVVASKFKNIAFRNTAS